MEQLEYNINQLINLQIYLKISVKNFLQMQTELLFYVGYGP